jgi:hypothetical protein
MPNDNITFATIMPLKVAIAQSASRHISKGASTRPGPELPSILKNNKQTKPSTD